ncbi:hypothetical protein BS47DRAFT_1334215 [Hydnum rufescens UP504]|uniref:U6 small nuclear RNA (adenine-(43)-N(6))-methyltransferase n=1 Tax=Hydnum rufescens UP504 TaxID=1448309 RepID=A0A9P6DJV8_9AGAM|nr:hypothetical protein BS47DRAFT_1334215 [Hydnum rufescens UP504]
MAPRSAIPSNLYSSPPDFDALAESYPPLKPHVFLNATGKPSINFKDIDAQRRLTEALLYRDFGLSLALPDGRLCPTRRLNYVRWIQSLVRSVRPWESDVTPDLVLGLDIGTGASAIYPLLSCAVEPLWRIVATDIDEISLEYARKNVNENDLSARVDIRRSSVEGPILHPLTDAALPIFDFTMCNPPFYSSAEDIVQSASAKDFDPHAVCTGSDIEMITPGGEVAFVQKILEESLSLKHRCRWFTSLLGKLTSVASMVDRFRETKIDNYAITEFVQGHTRRWAVGWSFGAVRLPDRIAHPTSSVLNSASPLPTTLHQHYPTPATVESLFSSLYAVLNDIDGVSYITKDPSNPDDINNGGNVPSDPGSERVLVSVGQNTWSRAARRRKQLSAPTTSLQSSVPSDLHVAEHASFWKCEISVEHSPPRHGAHGPTEFVLSVQWRVGASRGDFESFWSHVTRKVGAKLAGDPGDRKRS